MIAGLCNGTGVWYVCMYVCMYVMYVCMYVCMYACMYVKHISFCSNDIIDHKTFSITTHYPYMRHYVLDKCVINPQGACAARVAVVVLSVCLSVPTDSVAFKRYGVKNKRKSQYA